MAYVEPSEEQRSAMVIGAYLIETEQEHAVNAMTNKCIPEICRKCKKN